MAVALFRKKGEQFFDNAGQMLAGGKLYYHEAGTSNLQPTYSNAAGSTANTNPVVLDGYGRLQEAVYFGDTNSRVAYKETLTTSSTVIIAPWPMDNIPAASPELVDQSFASPQLVWTQATNAQSPVALSAADLGKAYEADTTLGSVEFDFPPAAGCTNRGFWFNKTAAANAMIWDPSGIETIDDSSTSVSIVDKNVTLGVFSNGAEWYTVGRKETVGTIKMWPTATAPNGWLECAGTAVSRTTYAALFAIIGTTYGVGDASTTFNLPDMRGRFARGWDHGAGTDPDAASRTNRGDGTTGDAVGTKQADQIDSHDHSLTFNMNSQSAVATGGTGFVAFGTADAPTSATGGNETRPKNVNLMFIIKA